LLNIVLPVAKTNAFKNDDEANGDSKNTFIQSNHTMQNDGTEMKIFQKTGITDVKKTKRKNTSFGRYT
jgi:hypothetical protein